MIQVGRIASIYCYPMKSMAGVAVEQSSLTEAGLESDRLYAFESSRAPAGMLRLNGSERRQMLLYQPHLRTDGSVEIRVPTDERLSVNSPSMLAYLETHIVNAGKFTLVHTSTPQTDVRPLSLMSLQTVQQLSTEMGLVLDPRRFRANLYLDLSGGPFPEDGLVGQTLRIGTTAMIFIQERDPRCRFITYDPGAPMATDPLFPLMKLLDRNHQGRAGVYATVRTPGPIRVGNEVYL